MGRLRPFWAGRRHAGHADRPVGRHPIRQDVRVPTPPPPDVALPFDDTPDEIESREELDHHLAAGTLAGLTVQGVHLDEDPPAALATVDVHGTLFVGCRFADQDTPADLVR